MSAPNSNLTTRKAEIENIDGYVAGSLTDTVIATDQKLHKLTYRIRGKIVEIGEDGTETVIGDTEEETTITEYWRVLDEATGAVVDGSLRYVPPTINGFRDDINLAGTTPTTEDINNAGWKNGDKGVGIGTDGSVWLIYAQGDPIKAISVQLT